MPRPATFFTALGAVATMMALAEPVRAQRSQLQRDFIGDCMDNEP